MLIIFLLRTTCHFKYKTLVRITMHNIAILFVSHIWWGQKDYRCGGGMENRILKKTGASTWRINKDQWRRFIYICIVKASSNKFSDRSVGSVTLRPSRKLWETDWPTKRIINRCDAPIVVPVRILNNTSIVTL